MNLLLLVVSYPPIINSASRLYLELSESLADMGHHVTVITSHPSDADMVDEEHEYFRGGAAKAPRNGVEIIRVSSLSFLTRISGGKAMRFLLSCLLFLWGGIRARRPDAILVYSPPIYLGTVGYALSIARKAPFVFNMQDIHPKVLFDSGVIKNRFIKRILSGMEKLCHRKARSFIVYSPGNRDYLLQKGVRTEVFVIPNWAETNVSGTVGSMDPVLSDRLVRGRFVVSYAGTLDAAQGLDIVLGAAERLQGHGDILFLLAGEGPAKPVLQSRLQEKGIDGVAFIPAMPNDRYVRFLHESDVCLVLLSPDIPVQTVPGKLANIMVCGRSVVAVVNRKGDAAEVIDRAGCGFCVAPGDVEGFSEALLKLYRNDGLRKQLGENGRRFAEKNFSRTVCTRRYETALRQSAKAPKRFESQPTQPDPTV